MMLKHFCFYFDLRSGVIMLGTLGLASILPLIVLTFTIFAYRKAITYSAPQLSNLIVPVSIVSLFILFVTFFSYILLLTGSLKRNHWELLPWLIINKLAVTFITIVVFYVTAIFITTHTALAVLFFIIGLIIISIFCYLWFCVFSLYQVIRLQNTVSQDDDEPIIGRDEDVVL